MFTVTKVTKTAVNVDTFADRDEAWAEFMKAGVEPEVRHATIDTVPVKSAWNNGARSIELARTTR